MVLMKVILSNVATSSNVIGISILWLILCSVLSKGIDAVQCFCTNKDKACPEPICEGNWCLVGFKSDVELVQVCATEGARNLEKCARKLNEWEEVCSCQDDFCNTFSTMRDRLKYYDNDPQAKNRDFEGFDTNNIIDVSKSNQRPQKNQHLILLLVVIPLGVGALAVCLIFVNYHCKMC